MSESSSMEQHLDSIQKWAKTLPPEAWTAGTPPLNSMDYQRAYRFFAVKTETGRILAGTGIAFRPSNCIKLAEHPRYGIVTHFVEAGEWIVDVL